MKYGALNGKECMMKAEWKSYAIYVVVTLAVMLPLLKPGFILTLDLVFTPWLAMPNELTSSYVFRAGLHALNIFIPADVIEKMVLMAILLLASIGMHRLIRAFENTAVNSEWGIYVASIFFAVNPFTYSRFMAGHYSMLLGYALLPWLAQSLWQLKKQPSLRRAVGLGVLTAVIGIVSIHTLVSAAILVAVGLICTLWAAGWRSIVRRYRRPTLAALATFIVLSSYWLVPLLLGQGKTADTIGSFTTADTRVFATQGDNPLMRIGNSLRLQGFWVEGRDLYLLPQDRALLWGLLSLGIIALVILGGAAMWPQRRRLVLWLAGSSLLALLLAAGLFGQLATQIGLREPHKVIALVALAYGVLLAFGISTLTNRLRQGNVAVYACCLVLLVGLPLWHMRVMFWGFDGQLTSRQYPADWFAVKQHLSESQGAVLFLPWHQYMSFRFAGRIIANPAPAFFGDKIIASEDPELGGASSGPQNERHLTITALLKNKQPNLADQLAKQQIEYVVLAKELDHQTYAYLDHEPNLRLEREYQTLKLYKNESWRMP
jgi:hypothetical protein